MQTSPKRMRHKYNAVPTEADGQRFDSKAEARFYHRLCELKRMGLVVQFLRQVPFHLPGGVKYVCDFMVFEESGEVRFIDVKGMDTAMSKAKRKMVADLYAPIIIEVVTDV